MGPGLTADQHYGADVQEGRFILGKIPKRPGIGPGAVHPPTVSIEQVRSIPWLWADESAYCPEGRAIYLPIEERGRHDRRLPG